MISLSGGADVLGAIGKTNPGTFGFPGGPVAPT
jgi:hypothetical protein